MDRVDSPTRDPLGLDHSLPPPRTLQPTMALRLAALRSRPDGRPSNRQAPELPRSHRPPWDDGLGAVLARALPSNSTAIPESRPARVRFRLHALRATPAPQSTASRTARQRVLASPAPHRTPTGKGRRPAMGPWAPVWLGSLRRSASTATLADGRSTPSAPTADHRHRLACRLMAVMPDQRPRSLGHRPPPQKGRPSAMAKRPVLRKGLGSLAAGPMARQMQPRMLRSWPVTMAR